MAFMAALSLLLAACGGTGSEPVDAETPDQAASTTAATDRSEDETDHSEDETDHSEDETDHSEHETDTHDEEETDHSEDELADGARTVDVVLTEFAFEPLGVEVKAGETVTFLISNEGAIDHEFRLSNPHRIEEHLAAGHDDHDDEGSHHSEDGDLYIQLAPGEKGELTVTFPEDTSLYTEIACLLPGHHEAGMIGRLEYVES